MSPSLGSVRPLALVVALVLSGCPGGTKGESERAAPETSPTTDTTPSASDPSPSSATCEAQRAQRVNQVVIYRLPRDASPYDRDSFVPRVRELTGDQANYPVRATLRYLLSEPTSRERVQGCTGLGDMADSIRSLDLSDGRLTIDLHDIRDSHGWIGTSHGGSAFQGTFALTLAQFDAIDEVLFEIEGSCQRFYEFTQAERCRPIDLARWR